MQPGDVVSTFDVSMDHLLVFMQVIFFGPKGIGDMKRNNSKQHASMTAEFFHVVEALVVSGPAILRENMKTASLLPLLRRLPAIWGENAGRGDHPLVFVVPGL